MDDNEISALIKQTVKDTLIPPQDKLKAEFAADVEELKASPHVGMKNLRVLQEKYRGLGLDEESLDISNKESVRTRGYLLRSDSPGG